MIASQKKNVTFGNNNSNNNNFLDASFSAYLNGSNTEESFMVRLAHPPQINTFNQKKKVEDGEIGIFGAEKYFKGTIDEDLPRTPTSNKAATPPNHSTNSREKDEEPFPPPRPSNQPATPSVRSESSWNSRSGLLGNTNRQRIDRSHSERNTSVKSFLASLGCNCNDKGAVKVKESKVHVQDISKQPTKSCDVARKTRSLSNRWTDEDAKRKNADFDDTNKKIREDCFTFPVLDSAKAAADHPAVKIELPPEVAAETEGEIVHTRTRRNSLDILGSPVLENGKKSFSLERKLTMLNWDGVTPRIENIDISKNGNNNDTGSDASSDLFEIESFTTNGNNGSLARQASDGNNGGRLSNATLPNGYAPSEASIDWSVVTASVADFSVASDYEDTKTSKTSRTMIPRNVKFGEMEKFKGPGILSGCTSLKAVRVAGDEPRMNGVEKTAAVGPIPRERCRLDSVTPIARFQAETKLMSTGFDTHKGQNGLSGTRTLQRAYSPHASHHLYIQ